MLTLNAVIKFDLKRLFTGSLVSVSFCLILFKVAQTLTLHAYVRLSKI